jgi:hypothetical protein
MVAGVPGHGGAAWAVLQYVLGLARMGHNVYLIEPVDTISQERRNYLNAVATAFGLTGRVALLDERRRRSAGLPFDLVTQVLARTDVLLNIAGTLRARELVDLPKLRVYVDLDPGFTQLWQVVEGINMGFDRHDRFVTVGLALNEDTCAIPRCGHDWLTTLPPVVLEHWPYSDADSRFGWTTVANWRSYGPIAADGVHYGQKAHSFRELLTLPAAMNEAPCVALGIDVGDANDLIRLKRHGWTVIDPRAVTRTPADYKRFIGTSRGELGVAKSGYVVSGSGWFSDRSACYLASGRPVVAQDTGFSQFVPVGEGLMAFTDVEEAQAAIAEVEGDYLRHRRAARELAVELFDSGRVLTTLLDRLL